MNRRELLRTTMLSAGLAAAGSLGGLAAWAEEPAAKPLDSEKKGKKPEAAKKKILLIGGNPDHPPGTHLYMKECELLAKCLRQTPGVETAVSNGWPKDAKMLEGLAAIALYSNPGAEHLFAPDHAEKAEALLKSGVGLAALHWGTGIGNSKNEKLVEKYIDCLGGAFGGWSRYVFSRSRIVQLEPKHPICRGWTDFDLKDEWYLNMRLKPEVKSLAQVRYENQDQVVMWTYERKDADGGRSFANTLGHYHENFGMEPIRKSMLNGILWTARLDIPAKGAPCEITAEDMKL
ncbi:MAG: ThuA domain-containing protein [Pirellulales bacterium]|nr:ThuA domain-containing protein [Pirellulales bacterium]